MLRFYAYMLYVSIAYIFTAYVILAESPCNDFFLFLRVLRGKA